MEDKTLNVISLVQAKIEEIVNERYIDENEKPQVYVSKMYEKGYVVTLIWDGGHKDAFDYRQSEFVTMNTDLYRLMEALHNRMM